MTVALADSPSRIEVNGVGNAVDSDGRPIGVADPVRRKWRLLIVDDCLLRRECVVKELAGRGAEVVQAWDLESFRNANERESVDVIVINVATAQANSIFEELMAAGAMSRVLVFGLTEDDCDDIVAFAEVGIVGYHLRSESMEDLITFIGRVAEGGSGCSARVSAILLRRLSQLATDYPDSPEPGLLTQREEEVLSLIELGLSNNEIGRRLHIATHTVKNHVHNVLNKLGARSRSEAAAMARKANTLKIQSHDARRD